MYINVYSEYLPLTSSLAKNENFSTQNAIVSLGQNPISPRVVRLSPRDLESCMLGIDSETIVLWQKVDGGSINH